MTRTSFYYSVFLGLLAVTLLGANWIDQGSDNQQAVPLGELPFEIGGWHGTTNPPLESNLLAKLHPTAYLSRQYTNGGSNLDLFIAYYAHQQAGETAHSPLLCLPGAGWEIDERRSLKIRSFDVNELAIRKDGTRLRVLYWYQSANRIHANEYLGKILLVRDAILFRQTSGSIVRVVVPDSPLGRETAFRFSNAIIPILFDLYQGKSSLPYQNK